MEDKCPFCGAADLSRGNNPEFICGTYEAHSTYGGKVIPYWDRDKDCYKRQLATLQGQVAGMRRAEKIVDHLIELRNMVQGMEVVHYVIKSGGLLLELKSLLSPTPAGEWVSVRREDLDFVITSITQNPEMEEIYEEVRNLKAALGSGGE